MRHLEGHVFGLLTAVSREVGTSKKTARWLCRCSCGATSHVRTAALLNGNTKSCGCRQGSPTHGQTRGHKGAMTPTYSSWRSMISRCFIKSNSAYAHYQKHGITVCDRWRFGEAGKNAFECFLEDAGERPGREFSIDRINNNGNYEPGNVRWATRRQQANNRRTNEFFEYLGETMTFAEVVRRTGLEKEFLRHRLLRAGWSVEQAVNCPKQQGRRDRHL